VIPREGVESIDAMIRVNGDTSKVIPREGVESIDTVGVHVRVFNLDL